MRKLARHRFSQEATSQPAWMLTFSDLLTLLLTFFVLRYALSEYSSSPDIDPETILKPVIPLEAYDDKESPNLMLTLEENSLQGNANEFSFANIIALKTFAKTATHKKYLVQVVSKFEKSTQKDSLFSSGWDRANARALAIYRQLIDAGVQANNLSFSIKELPSNTTGQPTLNKMATSTEIFNIIAYPAQISTINYGR